ncbi:uncharacterized protein Z520_08961 [Fonsecaea multimorphosa CBS 102226]|uniref:AB hydrolase-1 domain-containing protein n=1 Tax=Fonsecaea multimorphosa CBS 102226 TaxID=1442371 RepID=A0A0D2JY42_9EURO|nr:uncharacterized protein Z520_08961 [Fonsecaea multimorphosa CBS 102226]KIX95444.1 hypothetical protein Z520_08961 [Fonsecaea multimorphosa CBS 102226]OAL20976.1 hypothetical protein AYO22_08396 [Fonsecaea multimorphosa]
MTTTESTTKATTKATAPASTEISRHEFTKHDKTTSYLDAGPQDGPLLVFIHGWPAIAEIWKPQLRSFSALGFRVVAPDMPGYGQSLPKSKEKRDYSLEKVVAQMLQLLKHLGRSEAVWVGHGWGASVVWAVLAHNPEVCLGVVNMVFPYRTLEMGVAETLKYANRELYTEEEYPHAQWSYRVFYEDSDNYEKAITFFDKHVEGFIKFVYSRAAKEPEQDRDKPAFTANVVKDGGWFGGAESLPETETETEEELGDSLVDDDTHKSLVEAFSTGGFWSPTAYNLNDDVNLQWCEDWSVNEGVVSVPVLFIEALNDAVAGTYNSKICEPMKNFCRKLTTVNVDAGHWVALEAPQETNAAILRWIARELPEERAWPWGKKNPLKKNE